MLIKAFKKAASKIPAYQQLLKEHKVNYRAINNEEDFKRFVPIITKEGYFSRFEIDQLCFKGKINEAKVIMASSGFSGNFSFGLITADEITQNQKITDQALQYVFNTQQKNAFLINALPMGVRVYTSLTLAETGVRSDIVLALLKKISPQFSQTIILADPYFLKKAIEEASGQNIDWQKLKVSLILGGDWFPESLRAYLAKLINLDLDNPQERMIGSTFGIAELGLNLFQETKATINLRRACQNNADLRTDLFGIDLKVAPLIFYYFPNRLFLEDIDGELVFTQLNLSLIPLIRYNSKDKGKIFSYRQMQDVVKKFGLNLDLKLPLVAVSGRKDKFLEINGRRIYPEEIKQGLYEDFLAASLTTGYFRLNKEKLILEIQLKKGVNLTEDIKSRLRNALLKYVDTDLPIVPYPYQDFPYAMELDYERKFSHL